LLYINRNVLPEKGGPGSKLQWLNTVIRACKATPWRRKAQVIALCLLIKYILIG
jgi:hypothetical protein